MRELPFKAALGVWGSWFGVVLIVLVFIVQFYIAIWPLGGKPSDPKKAAENFFSESPSGLSESFN